MTTHVFGIRHHGPGCARSLRAALEKLKPDIVLVEGPPDAEGVLSFMLSKAMKPPVALLIYAPDDPKRAVYYPFTHFSPEWQALQYALKRKIPARFMDLPQSIQMAQIPAEVPVEETTAPTPVDTANNATISTQTLPADQTEATPVVDKVDQDEDAFALLARAAGFTDHEQWWELQIEQRRDMNNLFDGILEAMTALRSDLTPKNEHEAQREAFMRQTIRATEKEGFKRIAIICGAWHAPALVDAGNEKADAALLDGLKRIKVESTWIPWTNSRLSYRSGYGAGVTSPGWYEHLWSYPEKASIRWLTQAAHLLRKEGLDASSASVIEAVRLSDALAAMRDLPMAGMAELHEAIETVLCSGNAEPMRLIREHLEIGEKLGAVPPETPAVPLQRDLEARQKKLRLKATTEILDLEFNLREAAGRDKSQLFHQLSLLGIEWGKLQRVPSNKKGTFWEYWKVQWQVEFVVSLIEKNIWGNTIAIAATAYASHQADTFTELPQLTELLDKVILAELPKTVDHILERVQSSAAVSADVRHLMEALPDLAKVVRYSNVRGTKTEHITPIIDGLFERIIVGLAGACASLDDDAALAMVKSMDKAQESIHLLDRPEQHKEWQQLLRQLIEYEHIHGLVRGRCCRLLLEQKILSDEELQRLAGLALAPANPAPQAAAWVEGVLYGSGLILMHQDGLWKALDSWLTELTADTFIGLLPLLRRAFSGFQQPERRKMGEKVKNLHSPALAGKKGGSLLTEADGASLNQERADTVLPILARLLEVKLNAN